MEITRISRRDDILYILVIIALIVFYIVSMSLNNSLGRIDVIEYSDTYHCYFVNDQYARLGDALLHGNLKLDLPVSPELLSLDNPYSFEERFAAGSPEVPIYWDCSYYQGNYYSYFGVAPAVFIFIPYEIITGHWLSTANAILFLGIVAIASMAVFARRLNRTLFGDIRSVSCEIVCLLLLFSGCIVIYLGFVAKFYSIPILSSFIVTFFGLSLWMRAKDPRKNSEGQLRLAPLLCGSLLMSLDIACRPQFIFASLFAFFIFREEIFKRRTLFSANSLATSALALLPYIIVIVAVFWYNQARFGSPFDFGNNYNLTGFDVQSYSQKWPVTAALVATYLFWPMHLQSAFPYFAELSPYLPYSSPPIEPFYGGYFIIKPLMLFAFAPLIMHRRARNRKVLGLIVFCAAMAIFLLVYESRVAGLSQRYFADFGFYIAIASCIGFMLLYEKTGEGGKLAPRPILWTVIMLAFLFMFAIEVLSLFEPMHYDSVAQLNPSLYEAVSAFFEGR